jgi:hypothetical protein
MLSDIMLSVTIKLIMLSVVILKYANHGSITLGTMTLCIMTPSIIILSIMTYSIIIIIINDFQNYSVLSAIILSVTVTLIMLSIFILKYANDGSITLGTMTLFIMTPSVIIRSIMTYNINKKCHTRNYYMLSVAVC